VADGFSRSVKCPYGPVGARAVDDVGEDRSRCDRLVGRLGQGGDSIEVDCGCGCGCGCGESTGLGVHVSPVPVLDGGHRSAGLPL
jgi:hypothetical protein